MSERQKLYEISDELERTILDNVDPDTGELSDEVSTDIDNLVMDARAKSMAVAAYVRGLRAEASACDAILKRGRALKRQADSLEQYLEHHATKCGLRGERLADGYSEITWRRSTRVEIADPRAVPMEFCGDPPPSKTMLKNEMAKQGVEELKTEDGFVFARIDSDVRLRVK